MNTMAYDHQPAVVWRTELAKRAEELIGSTHSRFLALFAEELYKLAHWPEVRDWYLANNTISMWLPETICAATVAAVVTKGAVLEIGTYVGGATVALARGAGLAGRRVVSVDKGGEHLAHPTLPSKDILTDLRANVQRFGVAESVTIVGGNYGSESTRAEMTQGLRHEKVGLACIDADGHVDRTINIVAPYLTDEAVLIIDDYESIGASDKAPLTKVTVDRLCDIGYLETWGVLGGETWIGQICDGGRLAPDRTFVTRLLTPEEILQTTLLPPSEAGNPVGFVNVARMPDCFRASADDETDGRSPLLLLEDGKLLGPGHYPFTLVRDSGRGTFSHFRERLWFSTSDNSDPRTNGRKYEVLLGSQRLELILT